MGRQVVKFEKRQRPGVDDVEKARRITERSWQPMRRQLGAQRGTAVTAPKS